MRPASLDVNSTESTHTGIVPGTARHVYWQTIGVSKEVRSRQKSQKAMCLWLTGLSASGKSTIADLLDKRMSDAGMHTYILDGDNIRHGLNRDLGFSDTDRAENTRRITEVARLFVDAGIVVIVSFISPFRADRESARNSFAPGEFTEIFTDAPLAECERRDPKGLYAKARRGELPNFTGIDGDYEPPTSPEIWLNTAAYNPEECVERILLALKSLCSC